MRPIDADAFAYLVDNECPVYGCESLTTKAYVIAALKSEDKTPTIERMYGYKINELATTAKILEDTGITPEKLDTYLSESFNLANLLLDEMQEITHARITGFYKGFTNETDGR